jgi:hypothetical protein
MVVAVPFAQNQYLTAIFDCNYTYGQMKSRLKLVLPVFALCWLPAQGDTISYSDSGTFSSSTPSSDFSGPSETWSFSFDADTNPAVSDTGMGGFSFAFSDFSYSLDGSPVAITPTFIRFFSGTNFGGFAICFDGTTFGTCSEGLATDGPQMYTGTPSAPTLIPGTFLQDGFGVIVDSNTYGEPNTTLQATSTVPEPSTLLLTGICFLGVMTKSSWRRSPR